MTTPQPGDIALWTASDTPLDKAIAGASMSRYVHAAIFISDRLYCEAVWPRVRVSTLDASTPATIARPPYQDAAQATRAADAALLSIGATYDAVGVTAFGAGLVFPSWRDRIVATVTDAETVLKLHAGFCSQIVARALLAAGLTLPFGEDCSPAELAAWLGVPDAHL